MAAYADYQYYTDIFGGAAIPEAQFDSCAIRASRQIDLITMGRITESSWADSPEVKNAVCAVSEVVHSNDVRQAKVGFASSVTTGRVSVSYQTAEPLEAQIYGAVKAYLFPTGLLYRGCGYAAHQHRCDAL